MISTVNTINNKMANNSADISVSRYLATNQAIKSTERSPITLA
ncbi:hypothetical protein [Methanococcus voltae]|uniref:Uncharacterized protein n=2 Tax=Methanococcus voltae TaxID=2188 RepID=A0A8J7S5R3_METVO|nr:hypothetical protein [Methanococcus voltae]MBP2173056.1 hypothetical protein [Methanococcus voltae]MBP2201888.1 hypothetical protein [Methanococcus voltae]MCS3922053.1 hypothetical protein [Methanococcus voltae PS]